MSRTGFAPAEAHLAKVCTLLKTRLRDHPPFPTTPDPARTRDPYQALFRSIVYQQLSGKAAATILARTIALYPRQTFPSARTIAKADPEFLRTAGLSRQKSAALKDLAEKRISGVVPDPEDLEHLNDADIIARLTEVRGVGVWTVQMYLIFTLARPDVFPIDDLGVRKGAQHLYGETFTPKTLGAFGARYAPWRSAAAWHLWRIADTLTPG
jgi:DNA-3-methyladenine glycosylase II